MTDEEYQRELEEAERLQRQINNVIDQINRTNRENAKLEVELDNAIQNVSILISNCGELDKAVYEDMGYLSNVVGQADISTKEVFQALNELAVQYFSFKSISTASKNVTLTLYQVSPLERKSRRLICKTPSIGLHIASQQ